MFEIFTLLITQAINWSAPSNLTDALNDIGWSTIEAAELFDGHNHETRVDAATEWFNAQLERTA